MKLLDVVILTDHRYIEDSDDPYKHNVFYEDQLVGEALKEKGLSVDRKAWDDPAMDWSTTRTILIRSSWDYFDRFDEFSNWLNQVSHKTVLINSERLVHWNIDKHYLLDLKANGVHIAETLFVETGTSTTLKALHEQTGWTHTVLKPCISGAARHTYKLDAESIEAHEAIFQTLIQEEAMMLQPFQYKIVEQGEVSMMVFNGKYTHAILKKAKAGDFRVQDDFGGSVHDYTPTSEEIAFSEAAVKACPELPLYARVDIFTDNSGKLAVSELELIEPELWFRNCKDAAHELAQGIVEHLSTLA